MAETARKQLKLSFVYFLPCGIPPHKSKKDLLSPSIRYKLIQSAVKGKDHFRVLDTEIKKKTKCYTVSTIKDLKKKKFNKTDELYFLIGADEFENLNKWEKPSELAKMVTFIVLPRKTKSKKLKVPRVRNLKWKMLKAKRIDVSSTEIRKRLKVY